jgi:colanic acid/amylovoran biosynthesis protein
MPMKLLLIGNHTCGNRGDAAILRGLLEEIARQRPDAALTVTSRYPVSSRFLLGRDVVPDAFHAWHQKLGQGLKGKLKERLAKKAVPGLMMLCLRSGWSALAALLPRRLRLEIDQLETYDAVIQVGGSFFVDLYGTSQFDHPFAAMLARRPVFLIGHSMGPFDGGFYRKLTATLLGQARDVALREPVSKALIQERRFPMQRVSDGGDTAWLVMAGKGDGGPDWPWFGHGPQQRPAVAITVRELAPFDKRLNTTQQAYEAAFAALADALIAAGYRVIAASTCTGIDSYHRDDRMNALRIAERVQAKEHFHVVMDELNDVQLGQLFSRCQLVVGTRLHSAIISMNYGTPAVAINYEHKSAGIMQQLGVPALSQPVASLLDGSLTTHVLGLLPRIAGLRAEVGAAVARERERTAAMVARCLASIEKVPSAP